MMMLVWLVALAVLLWIAWMMMQRRGGIGGPPEDRAEAQLRERFARGEIDEATYRRMLDELRRS